MLNLLIFDIFYLSSALSQSVYLFVEIQSTVSSLKSTSNNIQLELTAAQKNLTDAQDKCEKDGGGNTCNEIPIGNELKTEANFTKVSNIRLHFLLLIMSKSEKNTFECGITVPFGCDICNDVYSFSRLAKILYLQFLKYTAILCEH